MWGWDKMLSLYRLSFFSTVFFTVLVTVLPQNSPKIWAGPLTCSTIYPASFIYEGIEVPDDPIYKDFYKLSLENPFTEDQYPDSVATQLSSKYKFSFNSRGIITGIKEHTYESDIPTFEFPVYSGNYYLNFASLWVGGIFRGDTLVTTARSEDMEPYFEYYFPIDRKEFYPSSAPDNYNSIRPITSELYSGYRTCYVDTFTLEHLEGIIDDADQLSEHKPLNLSVIQKTYTYNVSPFKNIIFLDYTITHNSYYLVEQAYVGLLVNGDVFKEGSYNPDDDLTGSFRELGMAYVIDNDGDPDDGYFPYDVSIPDGLGVRFMDCYPRVTDTNFNWWINYFEVDFGPRLKGTEEDPYRDFEHYGTGTPSGDRNKYYLMRHNEWDYDQITTSTITTTDSLWMYPGSYNVLHTFKGSNNRFMISIGPVNLFIASPVRFIFAMFGGEMVHIDPYNFSNLQNGEIEQYYQNLYFDIFMENAAYTKDMYREIINPLLPPISFELTDLSNNTAFISWDPWVFPEVTGYNVYIKLIPDSMILSPKVAIPSDYIDTTNCDIYELTSGLTDFEISELDPESLYYCALSHQVGDSEGALCRPVIIGDENSAYEMPPVTLAQEFVFYLNDFTIYWEAMSRDDIAFYRIYKTTDSALAYNRFHPFVYNDSSFVPFEPDTSLIRNNKTWYYYEIEPYDSVSGTITEYTDENPTDGAYYWVSAVTGTLFESPFSELVKAEQIAEPTRDIVVVLGHSYSIHDYVISDSLFDYYNRLLTGYDYEIYNWTDSNINYDICPSGYCTDWRDLTDFRLVIIEEYPSPKILSPDTEPLHKLLERIVVSRHDLAYFGTPSGNNDFSLNTMINLVPYDIGSFEYEYFNLDSSTLRGWPESYGVEQSIDSLGGFNVAIPANEELPFLNCDSENNRFKPSFATWFRTDVCYPLIAGFYPDENAEILYNYSSYFPETSELQGMPCGILNQHDFTNVYAFSFHLWSINETDARNLIDYLMENISSDVISEQTETLPENVTLYQNYPNPFNMSTRITFELSRKTPVTLSVYNILGQKVRTLIDDIKSAGTYSVEWDGRADGGGALATGVYIYRLKTDDGVKSSKMMLLK